MLEIEESLEIIIEWLEMPHKRGYKEARSAPTSERLPENPKGFRQAFLREVLKKVPLPLKVCLGGSIVFGFIMSMGDIAMDPGPYQPRSLKKKKS